MSHSFSITIEPGMQRRAWNAWCFAGGRGARLVVALGLLGALLFDLFKDGSPGTSGIVLLTAACLTVGIFAFFYLLGLRRAHARSEALIDGKAEYRLTEETIEASSALGSVALSWTALTEVRRHKDLVLLGFRGAMYSPIPASQIPEDALKYLYERAGKAGAKIIR